MNTVEDLKNLLPEIEGHLHYSFSQKEYLLLAFIHRSFYNEHRDLVLGHNERLEFLGDSVLGLIVSGYLYHHLPSQSEGHLSHLRAYLVGADPCAYYIQLLKVESFLRLGKGEAVNVGRGRDRILADLFEAIVGAIYLDGGLEAAQKFFLHHFSQYLDQIIEKPLHNWKAELQDYSQKKFQKPPAYQVIDELGPPHNKVFSIAVFIDGKEMGRGEGHSKKLAEQEAAENALRSLEKEENSDKN